MKKIIQIILYKNEQNNVLLYFIVQNFNGKTDFGNYRDRPCWGSIFSGRLLRGTTIPEREVPLKLFFALREQLQIRIAWNSENDCLPVFNGPQITSDGRMLS